MKTHRHHLIVASLALAACAWWSATVRPVAAQSATGAVAGLVELPPAPSTQRSFRGSLYRNRLTPDRSDPASPPPARSPYDDVVISAHPLDAPPPLLAPRTPVHMDQLSAQFMPRVLPVPAGTHVQFVNRDRFYHNVFSLSEGNQFDIGRRPTGEVVERVFDTPGEVEVFCDIHPQMNATVLVLDTPWFTQPDSTGAFRLEGLPVGRYRLRAFHPEHEALERDVEVGVGVPLTQRFAFVR